jgi:hypothetical protein
MLISEHRVENEVRPNRRKSAVTRPNAPITVKRITPNCSERQVPGPKKRLKTPKSFYTSPSAIPDPETAGYANWNIQPQANTRNHRGSVRSIPALSSYLLIIDELLDFNGSVHRDRAKPGGTSLDDWFLSPRTLSGGLVGGSTPKEKLEFPQAISGTVMVFNCACKLTCPRDK